MKRQSSLQRAFTNPRVLLGFSFCAVSCLLCAFGFAANSGGKLTAADRAVAMNKIAPWLLANTRGNNTEFLVVLKDQAKTDAARALTTKQEKGRFVRDTLWSKAQTTQAPLRALLDSRKAEYRAFYVVNAFWVKGDEDLMMELAARPDVDRIEGNPLIYNRLPQPQITKSRQPDEVTTVETGITYTHAPQVWALGYTGTGIVIAGADTGIRWTHNTLKAHYRGWNGTTADHNYNWHDSVHDAASGSCANNSTTPCDGHGHGTHTVGTAVGDDGAGNQIGMAPGAKWINCRNMDSAGNGTPARYLECMEFFLAPYPVGGTPAQGDSTKAPDITTNSWGCPSTEGCSTNTLLAGVQSQRNAGIEMVVAAGNSGPGCSTVSDPPSFYAPLYTVGALVTGQDTIATFSSRGPVTADGSNRRKPEICAPGNPVRSCWNTSDTTYNTISGTSMATPHIAGALALLLNAQPLLKHDWARMEQLINDNAVHLNPPVSSTCDPALTTYPNNVFGYGRIDIKAAVDKALIMPVLTGAASQQMHSGTPYNMGLALSGSPAVESRNIGGNLKLIFTFNNNVTSGSASITSGTGSVNGSPTFNAKTMTVNLTGVTDAQKITVKLSGVTDTTPQTLPDTSITIGVLGGDVNGDGSVNSSDISFVKSKSGQALDTSNFMADFNEDASVNSADISFVKSKSGSAIP